MVGSADDASDPHEGGDLRTTETTAPFDLTKIDGGIFEGATYEQVFGTIADTFGDRLLAARLVGDGDATSRYELAVYEPTQAEISYVRSITGLGEALVVRASAQDPEPYRTLRDDLTAEMSALKAPGFVRVATDWSSSAPAASVLVEGAFHSEEILRDRLTTVAAGRPFELKVVTGNATGVQPTLARPAHANPTATWSWPHHTSLRIDLEGGGFCTTNFVWEGAFGLFGSTAGHCADLDDDVFRSGYPYPFDHVRWDGHLEGGTTWTDTLLYQLVGNQVPSHNWVTTDTGHLKVKGRTNGHVAVGIPTCLYAGNNGTWTCKDVTIDRDLNVIDGTGTTIMDVECNDYRKVKGGASGGPVVFQFGNYLAHGVIHGHLSNPPTYACYTLVSYHVFFSGAEIWVP